MLEVARVMIIGKVRRGKGRVEEEEEEEKRQGKRGGWRRKVKGQEEG